MSRLCAYLLKKGRISELQYSRAKSKCASLNLNTGNCAYAFGFIERCQIQNVLGIQRRTGQKFGEIAVALGYLTAAQVNTILRIQEKYSVSIEEALVRDGALTSEELDQERNLFLSSQQKEW